MLHEWIHKRVVSATGTNIPASLIKESALRLQWLHVQHAEWGVTETTVFGVQLYDYVGVNRK